MDTPACIRLPFMRAAPQAPLVCARALWPGHASAVPEGAWQPDNYPLRPEAAAEFLRSLQQLTCADLDAMRNTLSAHNFSNAIRESEERAALCKFAGQPALRGALDAAIEFAQQLLLWSWQQEKTLSDLEDLERQCLLKEEDISRHFLEENEFRPARGQVSARMEPAWQPVTANAAFFISPCQAILAEGGMAEDLLDTLEFSPVEGEEYVPASYAGQLLRASAPLWRALGFKRPGSNEAAEIYNPQRTWLIWREE